MYKLYEKTLKDTENLYGLKEIDKNENPFINGPCLLCISAQFDAEMPKSNFGIAKEGMKVARLRVREQPNAGFDLKEFPVKFIAIQRDRKTERRKLFEKEAIIEFTNKYLFPLIEKNSLKIEVIQAMKNMRNVNILSNCDATSFVQEMEELLLNRMKELGYSEEECEKIQSQMCIFPISTNRLNGAQKSTCVSFKDINDSEVNDNVSIEQEQIVLQSNIGEALFKFSENELAYLFNGEGHHNLKRYTQAGRAMGVCLSSAVSKALENSIFNSRSEEFVPISARTTYRGF